MIVPFFVDNNKNFKWDFIYTYRSERNQSKT